MFGKVTSEVLGLSDVGKVIGRQDYDKVDADDYINHEENEKIYFLIKSKKDEYCFTNKGLIHVDGTSAISKKRTLRRFNYHEHTISGVSMETAGTVDLDVEIKFYIGSEHYSIDVHKQFIEQVKDLYKTLLSIAEIARENEYALSFAQQSLQLAATSVGRVANPENSAVDQFKEINEVAFSWLMNTRKKYHVKDFGFVFDKYINN